MGIFKHRLRTPSTPRLLNCEAVTGHLGADDENDYFLWERFKAALEPGERHGVVLHANMFAPPTTWDGGNFEPMPAGMVFFSDRRMLIDRDVWSTDGRRLIAEPSTVLVPYSAVEYFGLDPRTDKGWIVTTLPARGQVMGEVFGWDDRDPQHIVDGLSTAMHLMRVSCGQRHDGCVCSAPPGAKLGYFVQRPSRPVEPRSSPERRHRIPGMPGQLHDQDMPMNGLRITLRTPDGDTFAEDTVFTEATGPNGGHLYSGNGGFWAEVTDRPDGTHDLPDFGWADGRRGCVATNADPIIVG